MVMLILYFVLFKIDEVFISLKVWYCYLKKLIFIYLNGVLYYYVGYR